MSPNRTSWSFGRAGRTVAYVVVLMAAAGLSPAVAQTPEPLAAPAPATTAAPPPPTPTSGPAPAPGQSAAQTSQATYTINPGDELEIYVWGEERLQRVLRVLPDGTIAFPLVGQLRVQGLLPQNVERLVSERLKGQYRGDVPNVTVSVRNPSGLQFSVMGKVRSPGAFTPGRYVTVLDAITLAGGPAEFANMDNVAIIRREGGRTNTIRVRLAPVFRGGADLNLDRTNIVPLVAGDIVIVP